MKFTKTLLPVLAAVTLLTGAAAAEDLSDAPEVSAAGAVVMDFDSGRTLWEKNADEPRLIASTTKIMTALIVLEQCDPDLAVEIDPAWTGVEGSSMYLQPGQRLTVRELLYGLMLASGNDAAVALACVAAGGVDEFAALMNEKAVSLGCENTHFENPNGLDGKSHYASARDLAIITREALRNDEFRRIVSTVTATVGGQTFTNHNRLLRECEGVFGVKTGYTEAAGRTLVTCCERNGQTLICVTLADADDWTDHAALYDWAYAAHVRDEVLSTETAWPLPVIGGQSDTALAVPEHDLVVFHRTGETVVLSTRLPSFVYAAVTSGAPVGDVTAYLDGEPVGTVSLVCDRDVERQPAQLPTFLERLTAIFGRGERKIYTLT